MVLAVLAGLGASTASAQTEYVDVGDWAASPGIVRVPTIHKFDLKPPERGHCSIPVLEVPGPGFRVPEQIVCQENRGTPVGQSVYTASEVDAKAKVLTDRLDGLETKILGALSKLTPDDVAHALLAALETRVAELEKANQRIEKLEGRLKVLEDRSNLAVSQKPTQGAKP